jgi:hypothetical protein
MFNSTLAASRQSAFLEGGYCFGFTLRLADDVGLGVDLAPGWQGSQGLTIQEVLQNGAVASWNKQCFISNKLRAKAVWPGDTIVSVNGKTEYLDMLHECQNNMLLKLTVFRHDGTSTGATATDCSWARLDNLARGLTVCQTKDGERLHSSKSPVVLSNKL